MLYEMPAQLRVTYHVDTTKTFTTVFVTGARYEAIGTAKRNPRDAHDLQIGLDIAIARALRELADLMEEGAHA